MYHRIATPERDPWQLAVTPAHFAEHLEVIRHQGTPMPVRALTAQLTRGRVPRRAIVITIDDGYADNFHEARPLLQRLDVPATIFVAAGYVGRAAGFWWDELERRILAPADVPSRLQLRVRDAVHEFSTAGPRRTPDPDLGWRAASAPPTDRHRLFLDLYRLLKPLTDAERRRALDDLGGWNGVGAGPDATSRPLTVEEVRALGGDDLIEVGAHTLTHPQLSAQPAVEQQAEIRRSRAVLSEMTGQEVVSFAYPYGGRADYNADTVRMVGEAGFSGACSTVPGTVRHRTSPLEIPRLHVDDCDGDGLARRLAHWATGGG